MNDMGWYSADFHVHRPIDDVPDLLEAEGLNLGVVFTMWNNNNHWRDKRWPAKGDQMVGPDRLMSILNAEDERGGGAVDACTTCCSVRRWKPRAAGSRLAWTSSSKRRRNATVATSFPWIDVEKPFWWETPVVMALSRPDSIGLVHNHFYSYGVLDNEAWGRPRDEKAYPGAEGFAMSSTEIIYRYWNLGMKVKASAGSASGVLPNPVGYNRLYVKLDEPFALEPFYRNLRQGESFVTNGPMLFFDAWEAPGGDLRITVDVEAREPLEKVEIIANGVVIETFAAPPGKTRLETEVAVRGGLYTWVAARAFSESEHTIRMAHSQPIFFPGTWNLVSGRGLFRGVDRRADPPGPPGREHVRGRGAERASGRDLSRGSGVLRELPVAPSETAP